MPTDFEFAVTLNTGGRLDVELITSTLRDIEQMLSAIERMVTQAPSHARWTWAEDTRLGFVASPNGVDEGTLRRVVDVADIGFRNARAALHDDARVEWPSEFGSDARQSAERILRRLGELDSITVEATGHEPVTLEEVQLDDAVVGRPRRRVHSSVDGILEMVSRVQESRTVRAGLRDSATRRYVRCYLSAERWLDYLRQRNLWERRVVLYGRVAYDEEGNPLSIVDVDDIQAREQGVRLRDFQGAAPDIARGLSTDALIERLRGNG